MGHAVVKDLQELRASFLTPKGRGRTDVPEPEKPMTEGEKRIFDELTFLAEHILRIEELLKKMLSRLEEKGKMENPRLR